MLKILTLSMCGAFVVFAQSDPTLKSELIKTGLYSISGKSGNALLRLSANGLILVDGQVPGAYEDVMAKVRRISEQPVRVLITTDGRPQADISKFLAAGIKVIRQEDVAPDGYKFQMGGVEAQVLRFGNPGNGVVYFPNLRVLAVGSLLTQEDRATAIAGILKLDFDVAIPNSGPALSRADLEALGRRQTSISGLVK